MDNSVYITLSRQLGLFRDMANTANNLANVNTNGYNANHVMFSSLLVRDGKRGDMAFPNDVSMYRDTRVGPAKYTGATFDLALGGDGYFMLSTPLGTRYTRAGNFQLDGNGVLVSAEGYPVLDSGGQQIVFTPDDKEVVIGASGIISVDGEERAAIGVATFENEQLLERVGERLFDAGESTPQVPADPRVIQGMLENSNVQPVIEMTHMIDVSRAVGSTAKFIEVMYDLQRRSSDTWARQS